MGGEVNVTSFFFNLYDFHDIWPWRRKRGAGAKFRRLNQTGKFLRQKETPHMDRNLRNGPQGIEIYLLTGGSRWIHAP